MRIVEILCGDKFIPYLTSDDCDINCFLFHQLKDAAKDGVVIDKISWIRVSNVEPNYTLLDVDELNAKLDKWRVKAARINEERSEHVD